MPQKPNRKKRIIYFSLFTAFFIISIPVLILYSLGYRIESGSLSISGRGGIYVLADEPDVNVYIGDELKKTTGVFQREVVVKNLRPKDYLVVVGSEAFWPWAKLVAVKSGEVSALFPLLVPKSIQPKEILRDEKETYENVGKLFAPIVPAPKSTSTAKVKTATSSPLSAEGDVISKKNIKIWKEGSIIYAKWLGSIDRAPSYFCNADKGCDETIIIFGTHLSLGRIDFYPDRDDAIMLVLGDGVYAMETDNRTYHNFYPIFKGTKPDFRILGSTIYIKDAERLFSVEL